MPLTSTDQQLFTRIGSKAWFRRDPVVRAAETVKYGTLEFGVIREASKPSLEAPQIELRDPADCNRVVSRQATEKTESWGVKAANISMENLAYYFYADPPSRVEVAATALTDVAHEDAVVAAGPGAGPVVKLTDAEGEDIYNLTAVSAVKQGAAALVLDGDYEVVDLETGLIRLIAGGAANLTAGEAVNITVTMTPVARTDLVINPQAADNIEGDAWIQTQSVCGEHKWMRRCRASLAPAGANFSATDFSDLDFTLTVLSDAGALAGKSGGTFTKFKGDTV